MHPAHVMMALHRCKPKGYQYLIWATPNGTIRYTNILLPLASLIFPHTVTSQLTWTPDASQVGRHVICLIATDTSSTRTSPVASSPLCHNILVAMAAVGDVPVIDLNGADIAGNNYQSSFRKGQSTAHLNL